MGCEAGVEAAEAGEAGEADGEADDEAGIAVGEPLGLEVDGGDVPVMAPVMVVVTATEKQPMLVCPAKTSV